MAGLEKMELEKLMSEIRQKTKEQKPAACRSWGKLFLFLALIMGCWCYHASQAWADTVTYYFNSYDLGDINWDSDPANVVDNDPTPSTSGSTNASSEYMYLDGNTCPGTDLGTITDVELSAWFENNYDTGAGRDIVPRLTPYFSGTDLGADYDGTLGDYDPGPFQGPWHSIEADAAGPGTGNWTWSDVQNLQLKLGTYRPNVGRVFVFKVEIRVTYTPTGTTEQWGENSNCEYTSVTEDTFMDSGSNDYEEGSCDGNDAVRIGYRTDAGNRAMRSLIKFDLTQLDSLISSSSDISSATLKVKIAQKNGNDIAVDAFRILKSWSEGDQCHVNTDLEAGEATWRYQSYSTDWSTWGADSSGTDRASSADDTTTISATGWTSWDVTQSVKDMYDDGSDDGWVLKSQSESGTNWSAFYSSE
jgi:hypothetical protein